MPVRDHSFSRAPDLLCHRSGNTAHEIKTLPTTVAAYKQTPEFDEASLPVGLRKRHSTAPGVSGRIVVLAGTLRCRILEPEELLLDPEHPGVVEPEVPHEVEPWVASVST